MTLLEKFGSDINHSKNRIKKIKDRSSGGYLELNLSDLSQFRGINETNYTELQSSIGNYINTYGKEKFDLIAPIITEDIQDYLTFYKKHEDKLSNFEVSRNASNSYYDLASKKNKISHQSWKELCEVVNSLDSVQFDPTITREEMDIKLKKLRLEEARLTKEYKEKSLTTQEFYKLASQKEKELIAYQIKFQFLNESLKELKIEISRYLTPRNETAIKTSFLDKYICATYLSLFQEITAEELSEKDLIEILNLTQIESKNFNILENSLEKFYLILLDLKKFIPKEFKPLEQEWLEKVHQAFGEKLKTTIRKGKGVLAKGKDPYFLKRLDKNFKFLSEL